MKMQPQLRLSGWITGSLCGLFVANFFLVLFVAGSDIFLGQPPQFMVPLFALLIVAGSWALSRQRLTHAEMDASLNPTKAATIASPSSRQRQLNAPAYVAMTIIRRQPMLTSSISDDHWKGSVQ
jgi:hypothetical protein